MYNSLGIPGGSGGKTPPHNEASKAQSTMRDLAEKILKERASHQNCARIISESIESFLKTSIENFLKIQMEKGGAIHEAGGTMFILEEGTLRKALSDALKPKNIQEKVKELGYDEISKLSQNPGFRETIKPENIQSLIKKVLDGYKEFLSYSFGPENTQSHLPMNITLTFINPNSI